MKKTEASTKTKVSVLISVKPQYANCLVDGIKTIELRKSFPLDLGTGTKLYIYSSSPEQRVIGDCEIASVEKLTLDKLWARCIVEAMISWEEFQLYYAGKAEGVAITVQKPRRYLFPLKLPEFTNKTIIRPPQSFQYIERQV